MRARCYPEAVTDDRRKKPTVAELAALPGHNLADKFRHELGTRQDEAIAAMFESVAALEAAQRAAYLALIDRNQTIWIAKELGVPVQKLADLLGLSRDAVYKAIAQREPASE